jgi:streptomycin 6-kinase
VYSPSISIPAEFATWIRNTRGEAGKSWLNSLPARIDFLRATWKFEIDGPVWHGGIGIAFPVTRDGQPLVLKLAVPDATIRLDVEALVHWNGKGTVMVFDHDIQHGAMLLERLGPRHLDDLPWRAGIEVCGELVKEMSIPAMSGIPTVQRVANEMLDLIPYRWNRTERPITQAYVDRAIAIIRELAFDADDRMVNKDLHFLNVLSGSRQPWLAIDPKPLRGAPEFGVGQVFWRVLDRLDSPADLAWSLDTIAAIAELDTAKLRAWTFVRVIDYWLWALEVGLTEDPRRCKTLIDWMETKGSI